MPVAAPTTVTIYVALLDEGTDVWRPVQAQRQGDGSYLIVSSNDAPDDEKWQFPTGSTVRCELRKLSGGDRLVAVVEGT
jgi:hypothetical protein